MLRRVLALFGLAAAASAHDAPPHVLLVVIDDLGWRDTSPACWPDPEGDGPRHFRTPHLERLVREGTRFADAYASAPVCTPTRTSLMTGACPARSGITYWTRFHDRDQSADFPALVAPTWNVNGLQPGDVTLASLLSETHRTIHVGKAHFGTSPEGESGGGDPTQLGFNVNVAGWAAGGPGSFYGIDDFSAAKREARRGREGRDRSWDVPGLARYHGEDVFLTDALGAEAESSLRAAVEDGERVFLHFAPYAVHAPIMPNARFTELFPDLQGPELAYATMVASVDAALGRLLDALDELEIVDETLVVFTSDNGGLSAHGRGGERHVHNRPARSGKGSAYDGGLRVPLVVRWPGVVPSGRVAEGPVVTHDLFPTLLAATGVDVPAEHASRVDGFDLSRVLSGDVDALEPERSILWHQPHFWGVRGPGIEPFSALRRGRWKVVYFHSGAQTGGGPRLELYDVEADEGESRDLASAEPARLAAMAERLSIRLEDAGAAMSIARSTGEPVPLPREILR